MTIFQSSPLTGSDVILNKPLPASQSPQKYPEFISLNRALGVETQNLRGLSCRGWAGALTFAAGPEGPFLREEKGFARCDPESGAQPRVTPNSPHRPRQALSALLPSPCLSQPGAGALKEALYLFMIFFSRHPPNPQSPEAPLHNLRLCSKGLF